MVNIEHSAFAECNDLTSISVDSANSVYHSSGNCIVETKSKTLIVGCKTSVIPVDESVTSIGDSAFDRCNGLFDVTIPNGVTSIADHAFYASDLTQVTIPNSVKYIGQSAFGWTDLTTINFQGTKAQWQAIEKGYMWDYTIGDYTVHCTDGTISKADAS